LGKQIVIIGNGTPTEGSAERVDAGDLVIRFNDCRSYGVAGTRTDIVAVCNTGRPAHRMIDGDGWRMHPAVMQADAIWCVRDSSKFGELSVRLAASHPELSDFCDDRTEDFQRFAADSGKAFYALPRSCHDRLDRELATLGSHDHIAPSSGLLVIAHILETVAKPGDRVLLVGFNHEGWDGHPFAAERLWVDGHIAAGRLTR